ncbi:hypothetical protein V8F33_012508 [Rhypophila sp. PSN 637]
MSQSSSSLGSNNPFRRKPASAPVPQNPANPSVFPASPSTVDGLAITDSATPTNSGALSSSYQFRNQLRTLAQSSQPAPATTFQKSKVVKKVRVQSPPPSSPESTGIPDRYLLAGRGNHGAYEDDDENESSDDEADTDVEIPTRDPFGNEPTRALSEEDDDIPIWRETPNSVQKSSGGFEAALAEVTSASSATTVNPGVRATLDVSAFGRLLLTGESGGSERISSASLKSTLIEDTPRTVHQASGSAEPEAERHEVSGKAQARKPPPAPSSRHGKLINVELKPRSASTTPNAAMAPSSSPHPEGEFGANLSISPLQQLPSTPSDVNKPLPPAPFGPGHNDGESIFDREAAGKVPELDVDTDELRLQEQITPAPPNLSHSASIPSSPLAQSPLKPPPPPRRQPHGRSDSKLSVTSIPTSTAQLEGIEASPRRSSQESVRSRSSSLRANVHAPAPPPPRRSGHAPPPPPPPPQRGTNAFVSPSSSSFSSFTASIAEQTPSDAVESESPLPISSNHLTASDESKAGSNMNINLTPGSAIEQATSPTLGLHPNHSSSKLPPPPPPARSVSVRSKRPASVSSLDATSRRVTGSSHSFSMAPPPPPPPSRQRGGSKGSLDGSAVNNGLAGRSSIDGVRVLPGILAEEPGLVADGGSTALGGIDNGTGTGTGMSANDILADLTALQREVDALRGRYEEEGSR